MEVSPFRPLELRRPRAAAPESRTATSDISCGDPPGGRAWPPWKRPSWRRASLEPVLSRPLLLPFGVLECRVHCRTSFHLLTNLGRDGPLRPRRAAAKRFGPRSSPLRRATRSLCLPARSPSLG